LAWFMNFSQRYEPVSRQLVAIRGEIPAAFDVPGRNGT
jgi:hypothetical protein